MRLDLYSQPQQFGLCYCFSHKNKQGKTYIFILRDEPWAILWYGSHIYFSWSSLEISWMAKYLPFRKKKFLVTKKSKMQNQYSSELTSTMGFTVRNKENHCLHTSYIWLKNSKCFFNGILLVRHLHTFVISASPEACTAKASFCICIWFQNHLKNSDLWAQCLTTLCSHCFGCNPSLTCSLKALKFSRLFPLSSVLFSTK